MSEEVEVEKKVVNSENSKTIFYVHMHVEQVVWMHSPFQPGYADIPTHLRILEKKE